MIPRYAARRTDVVLLAVVLATVFVLDLWVPHGVGIAMLYSMLVLLAGWWVDRKRMVIVAGCSTVLVALPLLFFHGADFVPAIVVNHLLAMVTIWITCAVLWLHKQREEKVKRLAGLLPMCSLCKMIRDDKGLWSQVEQYFEEHYADLQFTHGLCPTCSKQLYPELFPKLSEQYPEVYK